MNFLIGVRGIVTKCTDQVKTELTHSEVHIGTAYYRTSRVSDSDTDLYFGGYVSFDGLETGYPE
jgi:hypothetical protein